MTSSTLVRPTATGDSSVVSNSVCFQQTRIGQAISRSCSWDVALLGLAAFNSFFQIVWFWKYASKNINYDAVSYIGIARHILDGNFRASLHGYWSPLISWCIVAGSLFSSNLLRDYVRLDHSCGRFAKCDHRRAGAAGSGGGGEQNPPLGRSGKANDIERDRAIKR